MTYCTKCGKQNPDTAKFCTGCGATLTKAIIQTTQPTTNTPKPITAIPPRKNKTAWIIVGIIIFLGLGIGAYFMFFNKKKVNPNSIAVTNSHSTKVVSEKNDTDNSLEPSASGSLTESEIFSFLNEWLNAQNNKNMVTYSNLYSQNFQGIKRIKTGQTYYYNHDDWINDRTKMYTSAKNLVMTVSDVRITENNGKTATVNFTHGYSSNAYKDIGEKQIHIEKGENGKIYITKEEMLDSTAPSSGNQGQTSYTDNDGRLVYKSDCFIIVTGSFSYEADVKKEVKRMKNKGYTNAGYLWIPDYPSLSGLRFYAPFIGPFQSYEECENNLRALSKTGSYWYGKKVSYDNTRVEIRL